MQETQIPGLGRSPGEGNGNLLQYSCLENSMDRGAWWVIVHEVAKSQTQETKDFLSCCCLCTHNGSADNCLLHHLSEKHGSYCERQSSHVPFHEV